MLTTLVLAALIGQEPTLTFTHRCARAGVVVAGLAEKLGRKMQVSGSVKDDYFLVRFDNTPVDAALGRIAKTLNATWTKSGDTEFLTRTTAQEKAEQREEQAAASAELGKYAETHEVPDLPDRAALTKVLQAGADARKRGFYGEPAVQAARLNPENIHGNALFQLLDRASLAALPIDGYDFISLRPHPGLVSMPPAAVKKIAEIEEYRAMYDDVKDEVYSQAGIKEPEGQLHRSLLSADELLYGAVRDQFTLQIITYSSEGDSAVITMGTFIDLSGFSNQEPSLPPAKGNFEMPFDRKVAEVFARPRSATPAPETSDRLYESLHGSQENDPLAWLASEPILQAAESEGWDVVAVLPDAVGWDAWWMPQAPGQPLESVLKQELAGWSVVEFNKDAHYLSIKPQMAGVFRRGRIDRAQVVKTIESVKARNGYLEEIAKFYEWEGQKESRSDLLRLLSCSINGIRTTALDREYDGDALMLLGSMSASEQALARHKDGMTFAASEASASLQKGLGRLIGRSATHRLEPKIVDGKVVGSSPPAIFAFLTSDSAQTMVSCRILRGDTVEAVGFVFTFPSGGVLSLSAEVKLPAKSDPRP